MAASTRVRPEKSGDHAAVRAIHESCFPTSDEADLVDTLRADGDAVLSLVAESGSDLVGHAMFSRMKAPFRALALAPVAVMRPWRRQGVAERLVRLGNDEARKTGWHAVFVLGDPDYYRRFGFSADLASRFESPYAGPYLMALALQAEGLPCSKGKLRHAPAFAALGK